MKIEECMAQYGDYLYRIAYMYTKDPHIAEEVIQDVFMKYHRTNQFDGRASLKTYLTRMTINCCHDHMRWWKVRTPQFLQPARRAEQGTEYVMIAQVEKDEIVAALLKLPVKYREVVFLFFYDDLTVKEISELIHIPVSTVTTRLQRAKEKLRQLLSPSDWEVLRDA